MKNKCQYCHEDNEGYSTVFGAFWINYSVHEGWLLHAGKCKPRPINYCPICGRRLNIPAYERMEAKVLPAILNVKYTEGGK